MPALYAEIFTHFRNAAESYGVYPTTLNHATSIFTSEFEKWQDVATFEKTELDASKPHGMDSCWLMVPVTRKMKKRARNSKAPFILVARNTANKKLVVITGEEDADGIRSLRSNHEHAGQLIGAVLGGKNIKGVNQNHRFSVIEDSFKKFFLMLVWSLVTHADTATHKIKSPKSTRRSIRHLARASAKTIIINRYEKMMRDILGCLDAETHEFCKNLDAEYASLNISDLKLYNHILDAKTSQEKDRRKGALTVLMKAGDVFLNERAFWEEVDSGKPLFDALSVVCKSKPATLRRMIKNADIYCIGGGFRTLAPALDVLDAAFWPQTREDLFYFSHMAELAKIHADAFGRNFETTLKSWAEDDFRKGRKKWRAIFEHRFARQISDFTSAPPSYNSLNWLNGRIGFDGVETGHSAKTCQRVVDRYRSQTGNITHMKDDLARRLIAPALTLAFEERGYRIAHAGLIDDLKVQMRDVMWSRSTPSEQVESSSYWHSPNINFNNRFQSIAGSADVAAEWATLTELPITLTENIVAYPLNSSHKLQEEGQAMHHCVWSYRHNCLAHNYHVFSLRDRKTDARISTLTMQDFFENGHRKIRHIEHKSKSNHDAPSQANTAERQLIKMVEKGEIEPDWTAIDADRAQYAIKQLDQLAGYDFRNPQQRERVIELYKPCIPRRLLKSNGEGFDDFAAHLGIPELVDRFLASYDPAIGGLEKIRAAGNAVAGQPRNPAP